MRYERKFRIETEALTAVGEIIRQHPAAFRPLHQTRQIHNIYFDTPDLATFQQNVNGQNERRKFRVRWYATDPHLVPAQVRFEIKRKHNEWGEKVVHDRPGFELTDLRPLTRAWQELYPEAGPLLPTLLNSYQRAYFRSHCGRFRLTVDWDLRYHGLRGHPRFDRYHLQDPAVILEVKYDSEEDGGIDFVTQHLPFRQTKHSKYVQGVQMTI
ncbi:MAG: polyphosphate polymerase domain-containing protein [Bacteroidetes bacterium]|nr:MAG: polyphosphate polymerase domain-containing protein [Bacteroidota bacterium]